MKTQEEAQYQTKQPPAEGHSEPVQSLAHMHTHTLQYCRSKGN